MKNQTKTQNMINGQSEPMKLIFNYNNVFYSFYYNDFSGCVHRSREYAINYVYSGEMILDNGKSRFMSERANASSYRVTTTLPCIKNKRR